MSLRRMFFGMQEPCPICDQTAQIQGVSAESGATYACPAGHVFTVAPE